MAQACRGPAMVTMTDGVRRERLDLAEGRENGGDVKPYGCTGKRRRRRWWFRGKGSNGGGHGSLSSALGSNGGRALRASQGRGRGRGKGVRARGNEAGFASR